MNAVVPSVSMKPERLPRLERIASAKTRSAVELVWRASATRALSFDPPTVVTAGRSHRPDAVLYADRLADAVGATVDVLLAAGTYLDKDLALAGAFVLASNTMDAALPEVPGLAPGQYSAHLALAAGLPRAIANLLAVAHGDFGGVPSTVEAQIVAGLAAPVRQSLGHAKEQT